MSSSIPFSNLPTPHLGAPDPILAEHYDTVDFGQFLGALKAHALTIAGFIAAAGLLALVHVMLATPQFLAQGVLYLGETQHDSDTSDASGPVNLSAYSTQSDVETQIGLLTTGTLVQRAVLETGLNSTLKPAGTAPLTYWRWKFFWHGGTRYFQPGPLTLQAVNTTLAGDYRIVTGPDNTYRLYGKGRLASRGPLLTGVIGLPEALNGQTITVRRTIAGQAPQALATDGQSPDGQSGDAAPKLPDMPAGLSYDLSVTAPDVMADAILGKLSVTAGGSPDQPTQLATLQMHWNDPYLAQQFVNQLMHDYIETQVQWKTQAASVTESFVTGQIAQVAQRLAQADDQLALLQAKTGILDPEQSAEQAASLTAQLETQRTAAQLQQQNFQQLHKSLVSKHALGDPYLISAANDPVLSGLSSSLAAAQLQLRRVSSEYTSAAPDVGDQQSQVSEIRASIAALIQNDLHQATENLKDINNVIASYNDRHKVQPADALKVAALKRTSDQLAQFYSLLTEKAEQAQISKAATIIATRIVTPANLPHQAASPKGSITVIAGAVAGLFLGIVFVFLRQTLSGKYESEEQVRRMVKLPVYGKVPVEKAINGGAFFGPQTPNAFSEAFRLIKRNIIMMTKGKRGAVILIISANKRDGKTTVAANVAKTFADDGKRVVLLDCDLYLSRLQQLLIFDGDMPQAEGDGDWDARPLDGRAAAELPSELRQWPGEAFWIYSAGALPRRGPWLDEAALAKIVNRLKRQYHYVILDSPPLPAVSDGLVLAGLANMVLSVVSVKNTERRTFDYHTELLAALKCPHGLIINGVEHANYAETEAYFMGLSLPTTRFAGWRAKAGDRIRAAAEWLNSAAARRGVKQHL